jgi:hypothetical protein
MTNQQCKETINALAEAGAIMFAPNNIWKAAELTLFGLEKRGYTITRAEPATSKHDTYTSNEPASQPRHKSDCALHNGPAEEPKPCDCGADPEMTPEKYGSEFPAPEPAAPSSDEVDREICSMRKAIAVAGKHSDFVVRIDILKSILDARDNSNFLEKAMWSALAFLTSDDFKAAKNTIDDALVKINLSHKGE